MLPRPQPPHPRGWLATNYLYLILFHCLHNTHQYPLPRLADMVYWINDWCGYASVACTYSVIGFAAFVVRPHTLCLVYPSPPPSLSLPPPPPCSPTATLSLLPPLIVQSYIRSDVS